MHDAVASVIDKKVDTIKLDIVVPNMRYM